MIALKAFQQLNVTKHHPLLVFPTSLCMASVEYFLIVKVVHVGYSLMVVLSVGLGAGIGAVCAMYAHRKLVN